MRTTTRIVNCNPGGRSISGLWLRKLHILEVDLEGLEYDIVLGLIPTPGARQVQYIPAFGILLFSSDISFPAGAKVYVHYEIP